MNKLHNYDIIKTNLCLSMLIYTYDSKSNSINKNILKLYQCDEIEGDLIEIQTNEIIINYFENNKGLSCLLCKNDKNKTITLIFKGTDDMIDMFYNIQTIKHPIIPHDNSKIHNGFLRILFGNDIYKQIYDNLENLIKEYDDYEIFFTGHSLGGSLCIVFSYLIYNKLIKNINIITFGCTKIGNYEFYMNYNNISNINLLRVCNKNDIIISLPLVNYYHVGNVLKLNDNDINFYHTKDSNYFDDFILFNRSLNNHYSKSYYMKLIALKNCF